MPVWREDVFEILCVNRALPLGMGKAFTEEDRKLIYGVVPGVDRARRFCSTVLNGEP